MTPTKEFLDANGLKQVELARYLSIGESFMSQVVKGLRPLPKPLLKLILANDRGWDVSMFSQPPVVGDNNSGVVINGGGNHGSIDNRHYYSDSPDVLRAQIDILEERIKEKDAQIKEKDAQIKEKDAQIKQLLDIIQGIKK